MSSPDALRTLVEPAVSAAGLELWDLESTAGVVRIVVDRPGGVDLDALGRLTQQVSALLDDHDDVVPGGRYHLELSSPGVERPLKTPEQYRRFVGTPVSVKTVAAVDGARRVHGVLQRVDDNGITLAPEENPAESLSLGYEQIQTAKTVLVWGPAPKPGQPGRPATTTPARRPASPSPTKDAAL